jgi:uncharacterized protein YdeI (YjbR/CyaY-like superfamily)
MAITYGMSVKEFWDEDPELFWAYRFSYLNKLKMEQEVFNHNAWLQGVYFYEGISVALNNAFSEQKIKYSEFPYGTQKPKEPIDKQQELIDRIKKRVAEVQAIKGQKNNSSTIYGKPRGGE